MATSKGRGRLLFLSPVVPADRGNGLAMRVGFFLQAYSRQFDVDLAVIPLVSTPATSRAFVRRHVRRMKLFPHPGVDSHFALVTSMTDRAAQLAAFRQFGRPSLASFAGVVVRGAVAEWMDAEQYDIVHVSRSYLADVLQYPIGAMAADRPVLVMDCDEDDARAYRRIGAIERGERRCHEAAWAEAEADAFSQLLRQVLPRFDLTFVASAEDAKPLSPWAARILVVPNVVSSRISPRRRKRQSAQKTVLFVGSMGYRPNDDAARWILTRVWPRVRTTVGASVRLLLAGSNPSRSLIRLASRPDICATGTVPDIGTFYREADLALVPIRAGGGTRIKLLEAAAWGVPIVATTAGAEGTTFRHRRDLLLADNAEQFARSCAALLQNTTYAMSLAARARRRILLDYDVDHWSRRIVQQVAALGGGGSDRRC